MKSSSGVSTLYSEYDVVFLNTGRNRRHKMLVLKWKCFCRLHHNMKIKIPNIQILLQLQLEEWIPNHHHYLDWTLCWLLLMEQMVYKQHITMNWHDENNREFGTQIGKIFHTKKSDMMIIVMSTSLYLYNSVWMKDKVYLNTLIIIFY